MESNEPRERRKYFRIATDPVISFTPVDAGVHLGVGKDVSVSRIRFEAVGVELGDMIRVTFNVGENTPVAVAELTWAAEIDPITRQVGLQFVEIDPRALRALQEDTVLTGFVRTAQLRACPWDELLRAFCGGRLSPDRAHHHAAPPRRERPSTPGDRTR